VNYSALSEAGEFPLGSIKVNMDAYLCYQISFGIYLYCVCDGHGLNGDKVAQYVIAEVLREIKSLNLVSLFILNLNNGVILTEIFERIQSNVES
jgi:serine/threonine protein phosphatase PrpC